MVAPHFQIPTSVLLIYCYVTNYPPKLISINQELLLSHAVSEGQESGVGWYRLRAFHEVAINLLSRATIMKI